MGYCKLTAGRFLLGVLAPACVALAASSCDSSATLFVSEVKFLDLVVISSVPMVTGKAPDGTPIYEPLCSTGGTKQPEGVMFNVLLQGTAKKDVPDKDQSLKPGDYVASNEILESKITDDLFTFSVNCMDKLPDGDPGACSGAVTGGDLAIQAIDFYKYGTLDFDPAGNAAVAMLVDLSGSMKGLVNPFPPFNEDTWENVTTALPPNFTFQVNASDSGGARIGAAKAFINLLNDDDSLMVMTYNENGYEVVCDWNRVTKQETLEGNMEECFTTDKSVIYYDNTDENSPFYGGPPSPLDQIAGDEKGRSPLWDSVLTTYNFMTASETADDADFRHIVVITDGPDTCSPSADLSQCSGACLQASTAFETVRDAILADELSKRIPISFVQMEAKGYSERDPRQMEMACLTGGQYTFINREVGKSDLLNAMSAVMRNLRFTLRGYWRFAIKMSSLNSANTPDAGYVYALEGNGSVLPGETSTSNVLDVSGEEKFEFGYNKNDDYKFFDARTVVRKECAAGTDPCPADEKEGACFTRKWWCDAQTKVCESALAWEPNGTSGGCGAKSAKLIVADQATPGSEPKVVDLGNNVTTVCCRGDCTPPKPPAVPEDVARPEGGTACFFYDDMTGWTHEVPSDPDSPWVYYATLKQNELCPWTKIEPYLKYDAMPTAADYPGAWECDEAVENCFPPAGEAPPAR